MLALKITLVFTAQIQANCGNGSLQGTVDGGRADFHAAKAKRITDILEFYERALGRLVIRETFVL